MITPDFLIWHCAGCGKAAEGKKKPCDCATMVGFRDGPTGKRETTCWDAPDEQPPIIAELERLKTVIDGLKLPDHYSASDKHMDQVSRAGIKTAIDIRIRELKGEKELGPANAAEQLAMTTAMLAGQPPATSTADSGSAAAADGASS